MILLIYRSKNDQAMMKWHGNEKINKGKKKGKGRIESIKISSL